MLLPFCTACATPAALPFTPIGPASYAVFVGNWAPETAPFCAVINDPDAWARVMHPAATMGQHAPFAPAAEFWRDHTVLVVARIAPGGAATKLFNAVAVTQSRGDVELDYLFRRPPEATYSIKAWLGVSLAQKVAGKVVLRENGLPACTLDPARGLWAGRGAMLIRTQSGHKHRQAMRLTCSNSAQTANAVTWIFPPPATPPSSAASSAHSAPIVRLMV
jgi:hypothetical protein